MTSQPDGESTTPAPDGDDSSDELPEQRSNPAVESDAEAGKTLVEQLDGILHEFAQTLVPEQQDLNQTLAETSLKPAMGRARSGLSSLSHSGSLRPRKLQSNRAGTADAGTEDVSQDYVTLGKLGEGGMGTVHLARQVALGREVALKQIHQRSSRRQSVRDEFLTEAVLTGKLEHPNIVPIYEVGQSEGGDLFYTMKNVNGRAWDETIDDLTLDQNLEILFDVCDAIAFAHAEGVIHRDLKPQNIMTGGFGEVLVLDWGLAVLVHPGEDVNAAAGGTPSYMAPEMINPPFLVGPRSDVYLLGAILFRFLTGKAPHAGKSARISLKAVTQNEIVEPDAERMQELDRTGELLNVAMKAMATVPADRYQTVGEFQQAVRDFESHQESLQLTTRAEEALEVAEQTGEYTQYSRSMIGFEEAVTLWAGNESAKDGVERTRHAYALSAERKKDFELGLSLLDASIPDQEELVKRLTVSRDEQNTRLQHIRITKRVLLGAFGLLVISSIFILDQRQRIAVNEKELAIATIEKDAAQQQSRIEVYYRNLADAQRLIQSSQIGRSSQALSLLQESSQIKFSSRDDSDLRTEIVSCLKDGELRSAGVLANGFNASVITFKPDGAVIAVGEDRHRFVNPKLKVHLYQFPSGELLRELTCPINVKYLIQNQGIDGMRRLLWSPDGRWLVASCRRGSIHIWDTTKNYSRQSLPTESPVECRLLFSPDSLHLYAAELSSSSNNLLRRFELGDKSVFREVCRAEIDCSNGLEISPDASHLYTCGVQHIQTLDAQSLEVLRDRPSAISLFTQSRNGKVRFILNDRTVGLSTEDGFDIRRAIGTGNELRDRIDVKRHLACTANGSICLTQTLGPPQIQFFESADGRLFGEWPLTDPKSTGFPAQLDPTGNYAAVPDGDHVKVIEIIHSNEHNFIGLATDYVQSGALSPKEQYAVAVTQFQDNDTSLKLTVLKRESDSFWNEHQIIRPRVLSRHHVRDSHVCFHPDGSRFVVSLNHCGQISQYNIDGVMQWELPMDTPREVAFSPDGRQLWITHSTKVQRLQLRNNNIDEVWNWDNTWAGLQRGGRTLSIAVGKTLAVASDSDGRIHVFSTERPAQKNLLQRDWSTQVASHLVPVTTIKVMKNDNYILCGDEIGKIYQIDCRTREVKSQHLHKQKVTSIGRVDDDLCFSAGLDGNVIFWRWQAGRIKESFRLPHGRPVRDANLSEGNRSRSLLITRQGEGTMHRWDLSRLENRFRDMAVWTDERMKTDAP